MSLDNIMAWLVSERFCRSPTTHQSSPSLTQASCQKWYSTLSSPNTHNSNSKLPGPWPMSPQEPLFSASPSSTRVAFLSSWNYWEARTSVLSNRQFGQSEILPATVLLTGTILLETAESSTWSTLFSKTWSKPTLSSTAPGPCPIFVEETLFPNMRISRKPFLCYAT